MAVAVPIAGHADTDPCADPFAKITQPDGGQLIVNGLVVQSGTGQSLTLSTTGTIDVVIQHSCALEVKLTVTKTSPGAPTVIHQNQWSPLDCRTCCAPWPEDSLRPRASAMGRSPSVPRVPF